MSFLSLSSAWLFLLLGPLIAFYFLKLKRPRQVIPSLVLWRQVLNDQRVNSPFQRFKRNLLLILQILLLTLLVLAAMQPLIRRQSVRTGRLPVLIDCSASMAALDKPGGITRLEAAKRQVRAMLKGLPGDQELSLIAFSKGARRLTGFTNNTRELEEALESLQVEEVPGDLEEVLRLAQALSRSAVFDHVLLLSDGNFPAHANFELPFKIEYQRLEPAGTNAGITACSARRALGGQWELFVQLSGSAIAETSMGGSVDFVQDGEVVATEAVTLVAGSSPRLAFKVVTDKAAAIEVRFNPSGFDSLSFDNTAWLNLPEPRPLDILVSVEMKAFRHALEALDGLRLFPKENETPSATYDLAFVDKAADLATPARVLCTVGLVPPELEKLVAMESRNSVAVDWRRDSPLLQHVVLDEVVFMDEPFTAPETSETDFANAGFTVVAQGGKGPLIVEKRERDNVRIHLLFSPERSTLPYRVGFPILVSNLVQLAQSGLAEAAASQTGVLPAATFEPNSTYRVEGPGNLRAEGRTDENGQLTGIAAPRAGEYMINGPGLADPVRMGASLVSAAESSLAGIDQIEFADQLTVRAADASVLKSDRTLWWPLLCMAFGLLLLEWWFFQKRPSTMAR
ncbi:MAG: hypothetical protein JWL90_890 [Chthoniobacteraceae bacterium]|nr:hypothetical protein [Chthoniobacteraceae bacterium]